MDQFDVKGIGNGSVNNDASQRNNISFCKHLEPGHLDSFNFGSLEFAINFLDEIGLEDIQAHLNKLSKKAMEKGGKLTMQDMMKL